MVLVLRRTPYNLRFCQVVTAQVKLNLCGEIRGPLFSSDLQTNCNVFDPEVSTARITPLDLFCVGCFSRIEPFYTFVFISDAADLSCICCYC